MTKTKAIRMPGKERPAASQTRTQGLRRRSLTIGILVKNTKPSAISLASETAEGLDRRFLRSQPRVLGPESLRRARPRRSEYQFNTQPKTTHFDRWPSRGYYLWQGSNRMENKKLAAGDRVRVSDDFFWAKGATGTISNPPDAVTAISGAWDGELTRRENSALGTNTVYWVWFDDPQYDADGDGPYRGGSIWESALTILTNNVN